MAHAMARWLLLLAVVMPLAGCIPLDEKDDPTQPPTDAGKPVGGETALVVTVIDGDTIDVRMSSKVYRVRYIGMNTPERDEACYYEATAANAVLVDGQQVTLVRDVSDTDRYGRLLRYVYVGAVFVNAELVAQGYAEAGYYPPDTAYSNHFRDLEADARRANAGCHPTGVFD